MKLTAAGLTDKGLVRENNEDSFWVDADTGLLIVADGMGGHAAGEVASRMAVDIIREQVALGLKTGRFPSIGPKPIHLSDRAHLLTAAVHAANEMIFAAAERGSTLRGMGTTVVAVWVNAQSFAVAHVGDSRLYLSSRGSLRQITRDHSLVAEQVARGLLTPEQAELSENKNVLTRAVGIASSMEVDTEEYPLKPGTTLLLCSDGLSRMVDDASAAMAIAGLNDPSQMCHNLVRLAVERGGKDNVTVVVGRMEPTGWLEKTGAFISGRRNGA